MATTTRGLGWGAAPRAVGCEFLLGERGNAAEVGRGSRIVRLGRGLARALCSAALCAGLAPTADANLDPPDGFTGPPGARGFTENRGQWPDAARFQSRHGATTTWLTRDGARVALRDDQGRTLALHLSFEGPDGPLAGSTASARGRRLHPEPRGEEPLAGRTHWLRGSDPGRWARDVRAFGSVRWPELLPGVDAIARSPRDEGAGFVRYDFELAAGRDPALLRLRLEGHSALALAADGALLIETALGTLRQRAPVAWQPSAAGPRPVPVRFVLHGDRGFGFAVDGRDPARPLVIDPVLVWSSFIGGSHDQEVTALALGPGDQVFVCGSSDSPDFPTTSGVVQPFNDAARDAFVACLAADGGGYSWATFLGGDDLDLAHDLVVSASGVVTVAGETRSDDFPTTSGSFGAFYTAGTDAFAARLAADGSQLIWSGMVGGTQLERAHAVALFPDDSVLLAGSTNGPFPTTPGSFQQHLAGGVGGDAFAARIAADGLDFVWATYLGGIGDDRITDAAIGPDGDVTLVGGTRSSNFPTTFGVFSAGWSGSEDGFVTRLAGSGDALVWSTYLGSNGTEVVNAVDVAADGRCALGGSASGSFPVTPGAAQTLSAGGGDGWIGLLSADGAALSFATFVGGAGADAVHGVAFTPGGGILAVGETDSLDFPATPGAFQGVLAGAANAATDAFLVRVAPSGSLFDYATYLGGSAADSARCVAAAGNQAAVLGGATASANFPSTGQTAQSSYASGATSMGFATRIALLAEPVEFGVGKPSSLGHPPRVRWLGFPSLTGGDFQVGLDSALPHRATVVFSGFAASSIPWLGGTLYVQPPLKREATLSNDFVGYTATAIAVDPALVGQTRYYQVWTEDPSDPFGAVMTPALEVRFHP